MTRTSLPTSRKAVICKLPAFPGRNEHSKAVESEELRLSAPSTPSLSAATLEAAWSATLCLYTNLSQICFQSKAGNAKIASRSCDILETTELRSISTNLCSHDNGSDSVEQNQSNTAIIYTNGENLISAEQNPIHESGGPNKFLWQDIDVALLVEPSAYTLIFRHNFMSNLEARNFGATLSSTLDALLETKSTKLFKDLNISQQDLQNIIAWNKIDFIPKKSLVHAEFSKVADSQPDAEAIDAWDGRMTYRELDNASTDISKELRRRGVGVGSWVLICFHKSRWSIASMLAVLKAGAAFVPVDPRFPESRIRQIIDVTNATHAVVAESDLAVLLKRSSPELQVVQATRLSVQGPSTDKQVEDLLSQPHDPAVCLFTSGSTGIPKGIIASHAAVCTGAWEFGRIGNANPADRMLQFASYTFDMSYADIVTALLHGSTLCIPSEDDRMGNLQEFIQRSRPTWANLTPTVARLLDPAVCSRTIRKLLLAGELVKESDIAGWIDGGAEVYNVYGPAENVLILNFGRIFKGAAYNTTRPRNTRVWIAAMDKRRLMPVGAIGELISEGPQVADGYLNDPTRTAASFLLDVDFFPNPTPEQSSPRRFYRTGDLARQFADGSYEVIGRADSQVKVGGQRIELSDIEAHIKSCRAAVVLPKKGPLVNRLTAILQTQRTPDADDSYFTPLNSAFVEEIRKKLIESLPPYMIPSHWLGIDKFPYSTSSKLDRKLLLDEVEILSQEQSMHLTQIDGDSQAHQTVSLNERQKLLQEICSQVFNLPKDRVIMNHSFTKLGGDSITAMQISSATRRAGLGFLSVKHILTSKSLLDVADQISEQTSSQLEIPVIEEQQLFRLSPMQQFFVETAHSSSAWHHYNQNVLLRLTVAVQPKLVEQALADIIQRHPMLRARFRASSDGKWMQYIATATDSDFQLEIISDDLSRDEQKRRMLQARQSLNLFEGPIVRAQLFEKPAEKDSLLFIVSHHIVIDLVSWRIIVEELEASIAALTEADSQAIAPVLPDRSQSIPFSAWVELQRRHSRRLIPAQTIPYGLSVPDTDFSFWGILPSQNVYSDVQEIRIALDPTLTSQLLYDCHRALRTEPIDILLASIFISFSKVFPEYALPPIFNESHGREPWNDWIDISQTVGWFTVVSPVLLENVNTDDTVDVVRRVKDWRRAMPAKGFQYFSSKYLTEEGRSAYKNHLPAEILFNYEGRYQSLEKEDAILKPESWTAGEELADMGPNLQRFCLFELSAAVLSDGKLHLTSAWNSKTRHQNRISSWLESVLPSVLQDVVGSLLNEREQLTLDNIGKRSTMDYFEIDSLAQTILAIPEVENLGDVEAILDGSPMQDSLALSQLKTTNLGAYEIDFTWEVTTAHTEGAGQSIDPDQLLAAWHETVAAHPTLRTIFLESASATGSEMIYQIVLKEHMPCSVLLKAEDSQDALQQLNSYTSYRDQGLFPDRKPPHRLLICSNSDRRTFVRLQVNHILFDGMSQKPLLQSLARAYGQDVLVSDRTRNTFGDFIRYIRDPERRNSSLLYWKNHLNGVKPCLFPHLLDARMDKESPKSQKPQRYHAPVPLEVKLSELQRVAGNLQVTIPTLVHLAWALVLQLYTGENHAVFGYIASGRDAPIDGIEDAIGPFIAMLVCFVDFGQDVNSSLVELMNSMQECSADAIAHQGASLAEIQSAIGLPGNSLLFNSGISFLPKLSRQSQIDRGQDLIFETITEKDPTEFDLSLFVEVDDIDGKIEMHFDFLGSAFGSEHIKRVAGSLSHMLSELVRDPHQSLRDILKPGKHDMTSLLQWNSPLITPLEKCAHEIFAERVRAFPDREAIYSWDGIMTYKQLDDASTCIGRHLLQYGIGPETLVPVCFEKSLWTVVAILGILKAGGAFVLLDPAHPEARLWNLINELEASVVVCSPLTAESRGFRLRAATETKTISIVEISQGLVDQLLSSRQHELDNAPICDSVKPENLMYAVFTSGTTGKPKGTLITHRALATGLREHAVATGMTLLGPDTRSLQFASYSFDASIGDIFTTIEVGGCLCILREEDRSPVEVTAFVARSRATWAGITPSFAALLDPLSVSTLKALCLAGEPLSVQQVNAWASRLQLINILDRDDGPIIVDLLKRASLGDSDMLVCFVCVRPDSESSKESFASEELIPTDADSIEKLRSVVAKILRQPSTTSSLPRYMLPQAYIPINKIPLSTSGKTDRRALQVATSALARDQLVGYTAALTISTNGDDLETDEELLLGKLWEKVLNVQVTSKRSNFYNLGADSVIAMRLRAECRRVGIDLSIAEIFANPDLIDMASLLTSTSTTISSTASSTLVSSSASTISEGSCSEPFSLVRHLDIKFDDESLQEISAECSLSIEDIEDIYPCSPMQEALMAISSSDPKQQAYCLHAAFTLPLEMDVSRFLLAWEQTSVRFAMMRSRIILKPHGSFIVVARSAPAAYSVTGKSCAEQMASQRTQAFSYGSPLLRLGVVLGEQGGPSSFIISVHHAAYDGWSMKLIWDTVIGFFRGDPGPTHPSPSFQSFIRGLNLKSTLPSEDYWKNQLIGQDENGFKWPPVASSHKPSASSSKTFRFNYIAQASRNLSLTTADLVNAVWAMTLARYSDSTLVSYGVTLSGRDIALPHIEDIVGPTIATVPRQVEVRHDMSLADYLRTLQQVINSALPHQHLGLQKIQSLSPAAREACDFNTLLVITPGSLTDNSLLNELGIVPLPIDSADFHPYPLVLECSIEDGSLNIEAAFDPHCIDESTLTLAMQQFDHILQNVSQCTSDSSLSDIGSLMDTAPSHIDAILDFNSSQPKGFVPRLVHEIVEQTAHEQPSDMAVMSHDGTLTYQQLDQFANILAQDILERKPPNSESRFVGLYIDKSAAALVSMLAILKAGCAFVPLDPTQPASRLEALVDTARVEIILTSPGHANHIDAWVQPGRRIVNAYGPTEACIYATARDVVQGGHQKSSRNIGKGLGLGVWVMRPESNTLAPIGAVGELCLSGQQLARGYLSTEEATLRSFSTQTFGTMPGSMRTARVYRTGDLVRYESDGSLEFLGRRDGQVKIRGQRIDVGEVQHHIQKSMAADTLFRHCTVQLCYPSSGDSQQGSAKTDPVLVAFLVMELDFVDVLSGVRFSHLRTSSADYPNTIATKLQHSLRAVLPSFMVPSIFIALNRLPNTASGKLDRGFIATCLGSLNLESLNSDNTEILRPLNAKEDMLGDWWVRLLGVHKSLMTVNSDFFSLGGNSLSAIKLVSLARSLGYKTTFSAIFSNPLLSDMANHIEPTSEDAVTSELPLSAPASAQFDLISESEAQSAIHYTLPKYGIDFEDVEDIYPATPFQESCIASTARTPYAYLLIAHMDIPTSDLTMLKRSWKSAFQRFGLLRTRMIPGHNGSALQVVTKKSALTWEEVPDIETFAKYVYDNHDYGQPLARVGFVKAASSLHDAEDTSGTVTVLFSASHGIYDGWSLYMIWSRLFSSPSTENDDDSGDRATPFKEFIRYQAALDPADAIPFWQKKLEGVSGAEFPEKPADIAANYMPMASWSIKQKLPLPTPDDIRQSGATVATIAQAAWALTVSHFSGSSDVIFKTVLSGRATAAAAGVPGIEEMAGPTAVLIPCRTRIDHSLSVSSFLAQCQNDQLEAIPHAHIGWERISRIDEDCNKACKLHSLFNFQAVAFDDLDAQAADVYCPRVYDNPKGFSPDALGVDLVTLVGGKEILVTFHYDPVILHSSQVESIMATFITLFEQMFHKPSSTPVGDLSALSQPHMETRQPQQVGFNGGSDTNAASSGSYIQHLVRQHVDRNPFHPAVESWHDSMTYMQLEDYSNSLAERLVRQGVRSNQAIGLVLDKSPWVIVAILGVLKAGGYLVPFDPSTDSSSLPDLLHHAKTSTVLVSPAYASIFSDVSGCRCIVVAADSLPIPTTAFLKPAYRSPLPPTASDYAFAFPPFSADAGSAPIFVTQGELCVALFQVGEQMAMDTETRSLLYNESWSTTMLVDILAPLAYGGTICCPPLGSSISNVGESIKSFGVNAVTIPVAVSRILEPNNMPALRQVCLYGDIPTRHDVARWSQRARLFLAWGVGDMGTIAFLGSPSQSQHGEFVGAATGTCASVVNPNNFSESVPPGAIGILKLHHFNLSSAHAGQIKTEGLQRFRVNADRTLTLIEPAAERKLQVNGHRIKIRDIEEAIRQHLPSSSDVVVDLYAPQILGDDVRLGAVVTASSTAPWTSEQGAAANLAGQIATALQPKLHASLSPTSIPSFFTALPAFPLTLAGQLDRSRLQELVRNAPADSLAICPEIHGYDAPLSPSERLLASLWIKTLNLDQSTELSRHDHFFDDWSGNELRALRLSAELKRHNRLLHVPTMFDHPTLGAMAAAMQPDGSSSQLPRSED
ncbi:hypothetical protein PTNB73_04857 [Pyrenophora teres f. teres]|nr:hypothetical protein PTNB73_04857 [Pyrenophora teres f. teres]